VLRIAGRDINANKKLWVGLAAIYGLGFHTSRQVCVLAGVDPECRGHTLGSDDVRRINDIISAGYVVEGDLRQEVVDNIKTMEGIGCYRGLRHRKGLPVHGQRTRTNARTRKGRALPVPNKKKL
jgi:small subunit ribosomal protein S13